MRNLTKTIIMGVAISVTPLLTAANDIYIQQVGDTLDLDIIQDGQDNSIGSDTQDVVLGSAGNASDNMTFSITQTGNSNAITAQILGATYTGTWTFTGNNNEVDLLCSSTSAANCNNVTLNIAATGDDQDYTINIGETAAHWILMSPAMVMSTDTQLTLMLRAEVTQLSLIKVVCMTTQST